MKKQDITVHIPITMLGDIWKGNFEKLPRNKTYQLVIDYPLVLPAYFAIRTGKKGMGLVELLGRIGKIYEAVYEKADKYGVRNHGIDDLSLCGITVKGDKITLDISS